MSLCSTACRNPSTGGAGSVGAHAHATEEEPTKDVHAGMVMQWEDGAFAQDEDAKGHLWSRVDVLVPNTRGRTNPQGVLQTNLQILRTQSIKCAAELLDKVLRRLFDAGGCETVSSLVEHIKDHRSA
eukprot:CAMPEP_0115330100 /NCGR_PEP_ID=MMETSP0270-20121206/85599_1 /TAXON_ID=71861 /ORGANISM="Scrippsiella trochoidea, Strain CCMP3099" /LENGTH=126 /DNA_ID=CAMNT_0002750797 /DNA_START=467 /DNA_END=846 /DNA_ORIENTATION=-